MVRPGEQSWAVFHSAPPAGKPESRQPWQPYSSSLKLRVSICERRMIIWCLGLAWCPSAFLCTWLAIPEFRDSEQQRFAVSLFCRSVGALPGSWKWARWPLVQPAASPRGSSPPPQPHLSFCAAEDEPQRCKRLSRPCLHHAGCVPLADPRHACSQAQIWQEAAQGIHVVTSLTGCPAGYSVLVRERCC